MMSRTSAGVILALALLLAGCSDSGPAPLATTAVVAGEQLSCLVAGAATCWGGNAFLGDTSAADPAASFQLAPAADSVAIGRHHACLLTGAGVSCWGSNLQGQLAVDAAPDRCLDRPCARGPLPVASLPGVTTLAAGAFHTCALAADGSVWCWGANTRGQLGREPSETPGAPAPVDGLEDVRAITAGFLHTCAVTGEGAVWCWGDADDGRLGLATDLEMEARPVRVEGLPGPAAAVAAGVTHTCALLADGSVACWGGNRFGELGDGTTASRPDPALVDGLPGKAEELAVGDHFSCVRATNGAVACWGWNDAGQLGLGSYDGPDEPDGFSASLAAMQVQGLPGPATAVAAGAGHACAVVGGATWCWGRNERGQLGEASLADRPGPVRVGSSLPAPTADAAPSASRPPGRLGIDVSYHSGRVDWDTVVDAGHHVAFTLSTAGVDFHDPLFFSHWSRMRGLRRGAYHFFVAHDDPRAQARWFIANTPLVPGDLAPVVDIETLGADPPEDLPDRLRAFVQEIERHYGVKPIVYTGPVFWNDNLGPGYGEHPLWIAEYGVPRPTVPRGWSGWALWQDRGDAKVPGVERVADLSRLADDLDLEELVIPRR